MDKEQLIQKALLLALTAGRRFLLLGWIAGLLALFGVLVWFLNKIHIVASILAVAVLLAYVLSPLVEFFTHPVRLVLPSTLALPGSLPAIRLSEHPRTFTLMTRGLPRVAAITVVYLILAIVISLAVAYVMPLVHEQFVTLTTNLTSLFSNLQVTVESALEWLRLNSPAFLQPWVSQVDPNDLRLEHFARELQSQIPTMVGTTFSGVFSGVKFAVGMLATIVLVPLFSFYILLDGDRYSRAFMRLVPQRWKDETHSLIRQIDDVLGRYIRGQLIVIVTVAISITVVLSMLGVEYAILIGIFAGVTEVMPYVGVAMGMVPAFIVALVQKGFWFAVMVVAVMEVVHWAQGHIVVPVVFGHSVGLPPLVVMVALGAGAELGGIMGMVLAIPAAAIIRVLGNHYADRLEQAEALSELEQQQAGVAVERLTSNTGELEEERREERQPSEVA